MAIQRVAMSGLTNKQIAELLGLTLNSSDGVSFSKSGNANKGFQFNGNDLQLANVTDNLVGVGFSNFKNATNLIYEKTETACVFGATYNGVDYMPFGYTIATNLTTGEQQYIYFLTQSGSRAGYFVRENSSAYVNPKSAMTFTDDGVVTMVNYYIPEWGLLCDNLYSIVTYKNRTDHTFNRFKLNDNYYIKPSGNNPEMTAPTTRYDCFAVRVG